MVDRYSQYQEIYNVLYTGKAIQLEFDYASQMDRFLRGLRTFKSRQDERMADLGFKDFSTTMNCSKVEGDNPEKVYVKVQFIPFNKIVVRTPRYTIMEEAPPDE